MDRDRGDQPSSSRASCEATGYVTVAERTPRAEDFPGAPPENLVAGSVVFTPPDHAVPLDDHFQWWRYVDGASWRHPLGPESIDRGAASDCPVVHVAYDDAHGLRDLGGQAAAHRGGVGVRGARRPVRASSIPGATNSTSGGQWMANSHQGHFPDATRARTASRASRR